MLFLCLIIAAPFVGVSGSCPDQTPGLPRWSDPGSWPGGIKPSRNDDVTISGPMLLDESPPRLHDVTIISSGRLVFDPAVPLHVRAANIIVDGSMEIGSEDCLYTNDLTITLTGTRSSHEGEVEPKAILVSTGGTLEIHGQRKMSWTKLNATVGPLYSENNPSLLLDHMTFDVRDPSIPVGSWVDRDWVKGLGAYTIRLDDQGQPEIKMFGVYDISDDDAETLVQQIQEVEDGDIFMLATQKSFNLKPKSDQETVFDAVERLIFGQVNYASKLRQVTKKSSYALVYVKGSNPALLAEETGEAGRGVLQATVEYNSLLYIAGCFPTGRRKFVDDSFTISTLDGLYPRIDVIDDVSTWNPGDQVVFASTDYDWDQAEVMTVVQCDDCSGNQIRINSTFKYTHWGEFMHSAVDMRAEVGLLTRNVVIEGEVLDKCPVENDNCRKKQVRDLDTFGGHIKIVQGFSAFHIEGVELRAMGQQTDPGRYPVHFHMLFDTAESQPYVRDCSIHNSFSRCVTVHGSHDVQTRFHLDAELASAMFQKFLDKRQEAAVYIIMDNVCYNHMGHGFFLEDGGEKNNTFDGNLAISTRVATGDLEPLDKTRPVSFWMTNPNTRFLNNVAAGGEGAGIWFLFPDRVLFPSSTFNLMDEFEARRTKIQDFYNNVAHSNDWNGITLGFRLSQDRLDIPQSHWQPLADPKNPDSEPIKFRLEKLTGYKNRFTNVWVEAGMVTVSKVSVSDSLNGVTVTNDGLVDKFTGQLEDSVVVGDSANIGVPDIINSRSVPDDDRLEEPHSGLTLWKGPTRVTNVWFGGSFYSRHYDIGAIAMKRFSPYFFSMQTTLTNMLFSFDDEEGGPRRAVSGIEGEDRGWKSRDGALMAGFTLNNTEAALATPTYVVRPDHLSAAADDCEVRNHWRLALCATKYGNLKTLSERTATYVRHDLPAAQLEFSLAGNGGPQVVLDGSRVYTVHFEDKIPSKLVFSGEGMELGDVLTIGVCLPPDATYVLKRTIPGAVRPEEFIYVGSLVDLQAETADDGRKVFKDDSTGMLYYKFIDTRVKSADEMHPCVDGECPNLIIDSIKGTKDDADCRRRLYGTDRNDPLPSQKKMRGTIPKNGGETPPEGWGAGSTRPFTTRDPVDGGYSGWSDWSQCSLTCGVGVRTRFRKCDDPIPSYGGKPCEGSNRETEACTGESCAVDGKFSTWSEWGDCVTNSESDCQGMATRTRDCTNPVPQNNGLGCQGYTAEVKQCDVCPES